MATQALTTLAANWHTTLHVDDTTGLCGSLPSYASISWAGGTEIVLIEACNAVAKTLTVKRAQQGTTAIAHPCGACVTLLESAPSATPCPAATTTAWTLPDAEVGVAYSQMLDVPDDLGIDEYLIPDGMSLHMTAGRLYLTGTPTRRHVTAQIAIALHDANDCIVQHIIGVINVVDPCYVEPDCACYYYWSVTPPIVAVGAVQTFRFDPPETCPDGVTLQLDVFEADGTTPVLVNGEPLVLTIPAGQTNYTIDYGDVGQNLVFKPSAVQQACLAACSPSIPEQRRYVLPCQTSWSISRQQFIVGQTAQQTYRAQNIPPGCSLRLLAWKVGTPDTPFLVGGTQASVTLTADQPEVTFGNTFPDNSFAGAYYWAPDTTQSSCMVCEITPSRINFTVSSAAPCATTWNFTTSNTTFQVGVPQSVTYSAANLPSNCSLKLLAWKKVPGGPDVPLIIGGSQANVTLTNAQPTLTTTYTWPDSSWVGDYYWAPDETQAPCLTCQVLPNQLPFFVRAAPTTCPKPTRTAEAACGDVFAPLTVAVNQPFAYTEPFTGSTTVTATVTPSVPTLSITAGATSASIAGSIPTPGTYQMTFTANAPGCPPCSVSRQIVVPGAGAPTPAPPPPPAPPPAAGCPDTAGFSPKPSCGASSTVNITAGTSHTVSQGFTNVDATSVSVTPAAPGGSTIVQGSGQTVASISHSAWPAGTYDIVLTGSKAGCASCSVTVRLVVTAAASLTMSMRCSGCGGSDRTTPVTSYAECGGASRSVYVQGTPGATVYLRALLETNIASPCSSSLSSLGTGWSPHTIPASGDLCVGGGSPLVPEYANVTFEGSYSPVGPAQASTTLQVRLPCHKHNLAIGSTHPAGTFITTTAMNALAGAQVRYRHSPDNMTWTNGTAMTVPAPSPGQATSVVVDNFDAGFSFTVNQHDASTIRYDYTGGQLYMQVQVYDTVSASWITVPLCGC